MTRDEALHLIGCGARSGSGEIDRALAARVSEMAERLAGAPTDGLRDRYRRDLDELAEVRAVLSGQAPPASGLSHTMLSDLPLADPSYTRGVSDAVASRGAALYPGQVLADRYEIRKRLGQGGMGAVYEAYDRLKQDNIAIKVLLPEHLSSDRAKERFLNEAKIACKLAHPHIVKVFDVGVSGSSHFITMELLEGQTLRQRMEAQKLSRMPFPVETVVAYAGQLIEALDYANKVIVHRDLKPENVWVMDDGELKLMDFGIARAFTNTAMTQMGMSLGTAYYMAPEQLTGAKEIDWRADQFSLGVVLYELLTGQLPQGALQAPREIRKDIPASLSAAVMKAMAAQPVQRFSSWKDFASALARKGRAPVVPDISRLFGARNSYLIAGAVATAIVLVVALLSTGIASSVWNAIRPTSQEEIRNQQAEALRLQAEVEQSLKQIDDKQRDFQQQLRDANSALDRAKNQAGSDTSDAENDRLISQLILDESQKWVFNSEDVFKASSQNKVAAAFIQQHDYAAATNLLKPVVEALKPKGQMLSDIEVVHKSLRDVWAAQLEWEVYAKAHNIPVDGDAELKRLDDLATSLDEQGKYRKLIEDDVLARRTSRFREVLAQAQGQVQAADAVRTRAAAAAATAAATAAASKKLAAKMAVLQRLLGTWRNANSSNNYWEYIFSRMDEAQSVIFGQKIRQLGFADGSILRVVYALSFDYSDFELDEKGNGTMAIKMTVTSCSEGSRPLFCKPSGDYSLGTTGSERLTWLNIRDTYQKIQ